MTENLQDQNLVETSYSKGAEFEKLFAVFMKSDLGWEGYTIRPQLKSRFNNKGSQIDILGKKQDEDGIRFRKLSIFYLAICAVFFVIGFIILIDGGDEGVSVGLMTGGLLLEIAGFVALEYSKKRHTQNAWVECKNSSRRPPHRTG